MTGPGNPQPDSGPAGSGSGDPRPAGPRPAGSGSAASRPPDPAHRTPPKLPRPSPAPRADSPIIERLDARLADHRLSAAARDDLVAEFWLRDAARTPLIEPGRRPNERVVTFLWRDALAQDVLLFVNRLTDERNLADSLMRRVAGTDIWHLSYRMADAWRASYSFLPHHPGQRLPWTDAAGQVALRASLDRGRFDPGNPERIRNRAGSVQSVIALPGAPAQPWYRARAGVPRGTVEPAEIPGGPRVWVYRAAGIGDQGAVARAGAALPLLVAFDGDVWTSTQDLPTPLDNLIADSEIPPLAAILLDSGDRATRWATLDLDGGADRLVVDTVLPWARGRLPIATDPARVITCGQSLGALSALLTTTRFPDAVGAVLAQSASLWQPGALDVLAASVPGRVRAYLEVGTQEWILRDPNRQLARRLADAGADITLVEYNGGHDYACWRGGIADGLRWITRDWPRPE